MAPTVLSGTSGALYYKPAGTTATFAESAINATANTISVGSYMGFRVGDPVRVSIVNADTGAAGTGTLPTGLSAGTTYYVLSYDSATGDLQISATAGGTAIDLSDDGAAVAPNRFQISYASHVGVGQVREWSFEITREEIDVTTIGQASSQIAPFRTYIAGFADGEGSASIYTTDDDTTIANRLVADVLQREQAGASMKLYIDRVMSGTTVDETASRSITVDVILTSASFSVNPDDGQMVEVAFRPKEAPVFDLTKA